MESKDLMDDKIHFFNPPVSFNVRLAKKMISAELIWAKSVGDEGEYVHKIKFGDDHEDIYSFGNGEAYNQHGEDDVYADALEAEIGIFLWAWEPEDEIIPIIHPPSQFNIWVIRHKSDKDYTVYFNEDILFYLESKTEVEAFRKLVPSFTSDTVDETTIKRIEKELNKKK